MFVFELSRFDPTWQKVVLWDSEDPPDFNFNPNGAGLLNIA